MAAPGVHMIMWDRERLNEILRRIPRRLYFERKRDVSRIKNNAKRPLWTERPDFICADIRVQKRPVTVIVVRSLRE